MGKSQASETRSDLIPKLKPREVMRALLQMTMETEDTTERLSALVVPSWNLSLTGGAMRLYSNPLVLESA
jgi:hypothetical protein